MNVFHRVLSSIGAVVIGAFVLADSSATAEPHIYRAGAQNHDPESDFEKALDKFAEAPTLRPSSFKKAREFNIQSSRASFRWHVDTTHVINQEINVPLFVTFEPLAQKGAPAYKIEWYGFGEHGSTEDLTIVSQETFQRLYRILGSSHQAYDIYDVDAETNQTRELDWTLTKDEPTAHVGIHETTDAYDLSALPFVLAMKKRTPGVKRKVAIKSTSQSGPKVILADLIEYGPVKFADLNGDEFDAYRYAFRRMREDGGWSAWEYYVTDQTPYWLGLFGWFSDGHYSDISMSDYETLKTNVDEEYRSFIK